MCVRVAGGGRGVRRAIGGLLDETPADEIEGKLRGPLADALAVAAEGAIDRVGALSVRDGDVDEADRFGIGGAGGAGDSCNTEAQSCAGARSDAFGKRFGDFSGDCAVFCDEPSGHIGEGSLELVGIHNNSAKK